MNKKTKTNKATSTASKHEKPSKEAILRRRLVAGTVVASLALGVGSYLTNQENSEPSQYIEITENILDDAENLSIAGGTLSLRPGTVLRLSPENPDNIRDGGSNSSRDNVSTVLRNPLVALNPAQYLDGNGNNYYGFNLPSTDDESLGDFVWVSTDIVDQYVEGASGVTYGDFTGNGESFGKSQLEYNDLFGLSASAGGKGSQVATSEYLAAG